MRRLFLIDRFIKYLVLITLPIFYTSTTVLAIPTIVDIQTNNKDTQSLIELKLDKVYDYIPRIEATQGMIKIGFYNLQLKKTAQLEDIGQGVSLVKILQSGKETLLEISYKNILQNTTRLLNYEIIGKSIILKLDSPTIQNSSLDIKNPEKIPLEAKSPTKPSINNTLEDTFSNNNLEILFFLIVGLVAILFFVKLYQGLLLRNKLPLLSEKPRVLNVYHLSAKQKIWITEIANRQYALAVTPQSIQLVAEIKNEQQDLLSEITKDADFDIAKIKAILSRDLKEDSSQNNTKKASHLNKLGSFKSELRKRISKLKPIK